MYLEKLANAGAFVEGSIKTVDDWYVMSFPHKYVEGVPTSFEEFGLYTRIVHRIAVYTHFPNRIIEFMKNYDVRLEVAEILRTKTMIDTLLDYFEETSDYPTQNRYIPLYNSKIDFLQIVDGVLYISMFGGFKNFPIDDNLYDEMARVLGADIANTVMESINKRNQKEEK